MTITFATDADHLYYIEKSTTGDLDVQYHYKSWGETSSADRVGLADDISLCTTTRAWVDTTGNNARFINDKLYMYAKITTFDSHGIPTWVKISDDHSNNHLAGSSTTSITDWRLIEDGEAVDHCEPEYTTGYFKDGWIFSKPISPEQRLKNIIASRCAPYAITSNKNRKPIKTTDDIREVRARDTLKRVLGERKFRNFLKTGFVSVKARSGLVYQIFPGHGITSVYDREKLVERLCVVLNGGFPPTDSIIMRYLMILNNEKQFRGYAVKHSVGISRENPRNIDSRPLVEIYRELKGKVVA